MSRRVVERRSASPGRAEELAGVGTWSLDVASGRLTTNRAARTMLGWSGEDEPGLADFLAAIHPDDRALVQAHTERLLAVGQEYVVEHRVVLGSRESHMRAVACAELDAGGRVTRLHGITMDITDLRRAATEVAAERDRSRAVLDNLNEGYLLSSDGTVLEVNEALCRMTGFSSAELVGSAPPYPFWPPEQVAAVLEVHALLVATGGGQAEMDAVRKDGSRMRIALTATALPSVQTPLWSILMRDVTREREHERQLQLRAETDPLTGVRNSRAFRELLRTAVRAAYDGEPLALALIDVDHFKQVNDRYGHAVGDEVLVAVVERLSAATAGAGTLARVGGEEFALLMPGLDAIAGHRVLSRALRAVRGTPFPDVGTVTASAGVAELVTLTGMDDDGLFRLADALLYEAKSRGRDQVR